MLRLSANYEIFRTLIESERIGFRYLVLWFLFICRLRGDRGYPAQLLGGLLDVDYLVPVLLPVSGLRDSKAASGKLDEVTQSHTGAMSSNSSPYNVQ